MLYLIREKSFYSGEIEIVKIIVEKETEKMYKLNTPDVYRRNLNKSEVGRVIDGVIYTEDIKDGVEKWNEYYKEQIKLYEGRIEKTKKKNNRPGKYTGNKII